MASTSSRAGAELRYTRFGGGTGDSYKRVRTMTLQWDVALASVLQQCLPLVGSVA